MNNPSMQDTFIHRLIQKFRRKFSIRDWVTTNCEYHAAESLEVIFEDFKKEYNIEADFSDLKSSKDAYYRVIKEIYNNFFYIMSFKEYCKLVSIDKVLSKKDYSYLLANYG